MELSLYSRQALAHKRRYDEGFCLTNNCRLRVELAKRHDGGSGCRGPRQVFSCWAWNPSKKRHLPELYRQSTYSLRCIVLSTKMKISATPPFRAEHLGSLLRPDELLRKRAAYENKEISEAELTEVQNKAIKSIVQLQLSLGFQAISDGEYRSDLPSLQINVTAHAATTQHNHQSIMLTTFYLSDAPYSGAPSSNPSTASPT